MSEEKETGTKERRSRVAGAARKQKGRPGRSGAAAGTANRRGGGRKPPAPAPDAAPQKPARSRRAGAKRAVEPPAGAVAYEDQGSGGTGPAERAELAAPVQDGPVEQAGAALPAAEAAAPEPDSGVPSAENADVAAGPHTGTVEEEAGTPDPAPGADGAGGSEIADDSAPGDAAILLQPEPVSRMEVAVRAQQLKSGLAAVVGALPGKTTLPILNGLLIETVGEGHIRLTATNLDTTVSRVVEAVVREPGAATVTGRKFDEIAKALPDGCVLDLALKDEAVHVTCKATRTRYRLPTMPVDEFPTLPGILWKDHAFSLSGDVLRLMVARTAFAASTEETRPILNGVLWEFGDGEMGMVATNGHRLAATHVKVDTGAGRPEVIVHPSALAMVAAAPGKGEMVEVARTENHIGFRGAEWQIVTRLIGGPYPAYRNVLPKDNDKVLVADRTMLAAAVMRMNIVASEATHRVKFQLGLEPGFLALSVETSDLGTASEQVAVEYDGDPLEIGFNAKYLLELLGHLPKGAEVLMSFKAPERAATIRPKEDSAADGSPPVTEMLIMPLRLLN